MESECNTLTPQESQSAMKIAALMRTARKRKGLTQIEVSKHLDISQSALSKIESGLLVPSAPQWFDFCEMTGISPDSISSGGIERVSSASLLTDTDSPFKIPKIYRENRGSKMRAMLPFIQYFRSLVGDEKVYQYFRSIKMDEDAFVDLDSQISLRFCLDFGRMLISQGLLKASDFGRLTQSVSQSQTHGSLHRFYDNEPDSFNLLQILLLHSRQYECNFRYEIEDKKSNLLTMSVRPEKHLKDLPYRTDPVLGDFLCQYKRHYFERFTQYGGSPGANLREVECHFKGAESCIYELKLAG